jgi:excinuclease UvrABC nuclease subunit
MNIVMDADYQSIREVMERRGTMAGQNKRIPVVMVSKQRADHMDEVETRMRKVQIALPFIIGIISFIAGVRMF